MLRGLFELHFMANRISNIANSLKQLGETQVNEWDFMALLHKDIGELDVGRSLRRLGNLQVMEWDFRAALPAVNKLAHQEVNLVNLVKRAAHYKVIDWDFRSTKDQDAETSIESPSKQLASDFADLKHQKVKENLKAFLQFVVVNLIDEPEQAQILVQEIDTNVIRFKMVMIKRDVAMLIGREGHTASAIRSLLKTAASQQGVHALLEIVSLENDAKTKS